MPPRKQLKEDEIKEIQHLRGHMSARDIQKKYGIGAPRLYKIWRESKPLTNNAGESILQNINSAPLTIQKNSDVDSILQNTNSADSILQNTNRTLPVQSNIGEQLLFQIQNTLQNIDTTLQNIDSKIIETQEEVESVASDVEDIEDEVEDLETNTSTVVDLSRKIYEAIAVAENIMFYGPIVVGGIGIIAYTLKYVHRNKTGEFDLDSNL